MIISHRTDFPWRRRFNVTLALLAAWRHDVRLVAIVATARFKLIISLSMSACSLLCDAVAGMGSK